MKKWFTTLSVLFATLFLTACSFGDNDDVLDTDSDATYKATLVVQFDGKADQKEVLFEQGDSVMDVLEDNYEVEDEAGMVTAINGVAQNPTTNTYWMYKVNDKMAEKGAEELQVQEGDKIEFYLETSE